MVEIPTLRAFFALNLDVEATRHVHALGVALRALPSACEARWVPATKLHVTLKLIGDVDVGLAPALCDLLAPIAPRLALAPLSFAALDAFPDQAAARVLVLSLEDTSGQLARLASEVDDACDALGLPRESRDYRPHVTLGRLVRPSPVAGWLGEGPPLPAPARASEICLYRSDTGSAGHEYAALARLGLAPFR